MEEENKERKDKHLLPVETFYKLGEVEKKRNEAPKVELLYSEIDLIFNHKNIWANLQCHDPAQIYYGLHKDEYWLPLIRDPIYPHPRDEESWNLFNKWLKKNKNKQEGIFKSGSQPLITGSSLLDYKIRGDFMKPF